MSDFVTGDVMRSRKKHPCGGNTWRILRVGADIKFECATCGRIIDVPRREAAKRFLNI
ncbi:MAG: DUF951 domain-containing protein [Clostridia bacterium]|nr:DUF951 domain-containing protein [Clostridia bacterium]